MPARAAPGRSCTGRRHRTAARRTRPWTSGRSASGPPTRSRPDRAASSRPPPRARAPPPAPELVRPPAPHRLDADRLGEPDDEIEQWIRDADLLLRQRARHLSPTVDVPLPSHLSVSALVTLRRDPAELARRLRR